MATITIGTAGSGPEGELLNLRSNKLGEYDKTPSHFRWRDQFLRLLPHHKTALEEHGLYVHEIKSSYASYQKVLHSETLFPKEKPHYVVRSRYKNASIKDLLPRGIGDVQQEGNDVFLSKKQLTAFADFLHQQIEHTLDSAVARPGRFQFKRKKQRNNNIKTARQATHQLFDFMSKGSIFGKEHVNQDLENQESQACHAAEQTDWEISIKWKIEADFNVQNPKTNHKNDNGEEPLTTLEGVTHVPGHGYKIELNEHFRMYTFQGDAQKALADVMWSHIHEVTNGRFQNVQKCNAEEAAIYLTAQEVEQLTLNLGNAIIPPEGTSEGSWVPQMLLDDVELEERTLLTRRDIVIEAARTKRDQAFQNIKRQVNDTEIRIKAGAKSSTALTTAFASSGMHQAWVLFNKSRENEPIVDQVIADINVMGRNLELLAKDGETDQEQLDAFSRKFYTTISLCRISTDILITYLEKGSKAENRNHPLLNTPILERLREMDQAFSNLSMLSGKIDEEQLPGHHQDFLETLRKATLQGGGVLRNTSEEGVDATIEWFEDMKGLYLDFPIVGVLAGVLMYQVGTMETPRDIYNNSTENAVQQVTQVTAPVYDPILDGGLFLEPSPPEPVAESDKKEQVNYINVDPDNIPAAERNEVNIAPHDHIFFWILKMKHEATDNTIRKPANSQLNGIDHLLMTSSDYVRDQLGIATDDSHEEYESGMITSARPHIETVANTYFDYNLFIQNPSHINLLIWSSLTGFAHSTFGIGRAFRFLNGIRDLEYSTRKRLPFSTPGALIGASWNTAQHLLLEQRWDFSYEPMLAGLIIGTTAGVGLSKAYNWTRRRKPGGAGETIAEALVDKGFHNDELTNELRALNAQAVEIAFEEMVDTRSAQLSCKFGRLTESFELNSENYGGILYALDVIEYISEHMADTLGLIDSSIGHSHGCSSSCNHDHGSKWYKNYLAEQVKYLRAYLDAYQNNEINERQLQKFIQHPVKNIISTEVFLTQESSLYTALFNKDMDERTTTLMEKTGETKRNYRGRLNRLDRHWKKISKPKEKLYITGLGSIHETEHDGQKTTKTPDGFVKSAVVLAGTATTLPIAAGNSLRRNVWAARSNAFKVGLATTLSVGATTGLALDYVYHQPNPVSETIGDAQGIAVTGGNAVAYNTAEDILILHTLAILSGVLSGAAAGGLYRLGLKPFKIIIDEAQIPEAMKKTMRGAIAAGEGAAMAGFFVYVANKFGATPELEQALAATALLEALLISKQVAPEAVKTAYEKCVNGWKAFSSATGTALQITPAAIDIAGKTVVEKLQPAGAAVKTAKETVQTYTSNTWVGEKIGVVAPYTPHI